MPKQSHQSSPPPKFLDDCDVDDLLFDSENPRLPEGTVSKKKANIADAQPEIFEYFRTYGNLDELARSYADNGYFKTEPLIATKDGAPLGKLIVLKGNRRLAAIHLVLNGSADELDRLDVRVDSSSKKLLGKVPVLIVLHREDATAMIGFRHIGGLKLWDSDAKARWIANHVNAAHKQEDPFGHVSRMVGMPRAQIRYYYIAACLANVARDELKYDVRRLADQDRFGVFLRAVENPHVRSFVGLAEVSTYAEAKRAVGAVSKKAKDLSLVLDDISKPLANGKFVVGDSRNIPKYGEILANKEAYKALRQDSFDAAVLALAPIVLADDVRRVLRQLERLRGKLDSEETLSGEVVSGVKEIQRVARGLRTE